MGKCCVAGCGDVDVDYRTQTMKVKGYVLKQGDVITLDGGTGEVIMGEVKTLEPSLDANFERIMKIADTKRRLKVRTNADTPKDAETARRFGAEGIGLCRTEHMFFGADSIDSVREMIIADNREDREGTNAPNDGPPNGRHLDSMGSQTRAEVRSNESDGDQES
jgi:pyruvate,orthophosphate dikinase